MEGLLPPPSTRQADAVQVITATSAAIANITTEGVLMSYTVPANTMAIGTTYRFTAHGLVGAASGAIVTFRIRVNGVGGALAMAIPITASALLTGKGWSLDAMVTCRTTGISGTVLGNGFCINEISTTLPNAARTSINNTPVAIDTTISRTLDLTAQWTAANASNTVQITNGLIELARL